MVLDREEKFVFSLFLGLAVLSLFLYFTFSRAGAGIQRDLEDALAQVRPVGSSNKIRFWGLDSWQHLKEDTYVFDQDRLFTGDSKALVTFADNTIIQLQPHSLLVFTKDKMGDLVFDVSDGSVLILNSGGRTSAQVKGSLIKPLPVGSQVNADGPNRAVASTGEESSGALSVGLLDLSAPEVGTGALDPDSMPATEDVGADPVVAFAPEVILPRAPKWVDTKNEFFLDGIQFPEIQWTDHVENLQNKVQISLDPEFTQVVREHFTPRNRFTWSEAIPGKFYARVQGVAANFQNSESSQVREIIVRMAAPRNLQLLSSHLDAQANKANLVLSWIGHPQTDQYEVQVCQDKEFKEFEQFYSDRTAFSWFTEGQKKTYVRVRSLKEGRKPMSEFSEIAMIEVDPYRGIATVDGQNALQTAEEKPAEWRRPRPKYWVAGGIGANYFQLDQGRSDGADSSYKGMMAPTAMLEAAYVWNKKLLTSLSYHQFLGKLEATTFAGRASADFQWNTLILENRYFLKRKEKFDYSLIFGFQQHRTPNGSLNADNTITFEYETITNLSLGGLVEFIAAEDIVLELFLRYQYPLLSAGAGGSEFNVTPNLIFDGSVGVVKFWRKNYRLGLYWFGQYHSFSHEGQSQGLPLSGTRDYLNSNLQFRLTYDFY